MQTIQTSLIRAQVLDAFGGPEQLTQRRLPIAGPAAGHVQLQVHAAAVNPVDLSTRAGLNISEADARFPMVLGWDVAGTIAQVGEGVEGWEVGDRVAAMSFQPIDQVGTYAERINIAADLVARVPDRLALDRAATIPLAGLTASLLVREVGLPAGGTLLVNAPLGAVGRLLVQLAAVAGISVIGVAAPERREAAVALGVHETVGRDVVTAAVEQRYPGGVDAAIDLVGGEAARAALTAVRDGGTYRTAVPQYIDATGPFEPERGIDHAVATVETNTPELERLLMAAARGELTTAIECTYPLSEAAQAHRRQAQGGLNGKLILVP
jgi:NADPH2:quinone reductase